MTMKKRTRILVISVLSAMVLCGVSAAVEKKAPVKAAPAVKTEEKTAVDAPAPAAAPAPVETKTEEKKDEPVQPFADSAREIKTDEADQAGAVASPENFDKGYRAFSTNNF
jgi:PBP1b-binding outer membrane lipoprotein LpoB